MDTSKFLRKSMRCSRGNMKLGDKKYDYLRRDLVDAFLKVDTTDKKQYIKEKFDCENFALRTMSNAQLYFVDHFDINPAFGMCWVDGIDDLHAINFYIAKSPRAIVYIEPQTDKEYFLDGERVRFVLM